MNRLNGSGIEGTSRTESGLYRRHLEPAPSVGALLLLMVLLVAAAPCTASVVSSSSKSPVLVLVIALLGRIATSSAWSLAWGHWMRLVDWLKRRILVNKSCVVVID